MKTNILQPKQFMFFYRLMIAIIFVEGYIAYSLIQLAPIWGLFILVIILLSIALMILTRQMVDISKEYYLILDYKAKGVITSKSQITLLNIWWNVNSSILRDFRVKQLG